MDARFRTGRSLGRTLYMIDPETGEDTFIGVMDTRELATFACEAMNAATRPGPDETNGGRATNP